MLSLLDVVLSKLKASPKGLDFELSSGSAPVKPKGFNSGLDVKSSNFLCFYIVSVNSEPMIQPLATLIPLGFIDFYVSEYVIFVAQRFCRRLFPVTW